jgi:RimJ/RimL family protein N-acetyltransferase
MRKVFARAGYVQEAVYRRAWPAADGEMLDGIGYAILRDDWKSGTVTPVRWD